MTSKRTWKTCGINRFRRSFWGPKLVYFWSKLGYFFWSFFDYFLNHFWGYFGANFGTRSAQEGAKMSPRELWIGSKNQKAAFPKTLKTLGFFRFLESGGFPREARKLQKASQRLFQSSEASEKRDPYMYSKINLFWINFEMILGIILDPKASTKVTPKWMQKLIWKNLI